MLLVLLLQSISCLASIEHLSGGIQVRFYFPTEDTVTFEFWVKKYLLIGQE